MFGVSKKAMGDTVSERVQRARELVGCWDLAALGSPNKLHALLVVRAAADWWPSWGFCALVGPKF
jgi:hypothetical protein